jgi:dTDP-glucose 4,6-dehydratase
VRVLVTGGAGFIGANLLYEWSRLHPDDELATLDSLTYAGRLESIQPLIDSGRVRFLKHDVADPVAVRDAVRGVDLILHLAAESHVDRSIAEPAPFVRTNVVGTQVLLDAARAADVGWYHQVSTDEVYGSLPIDPASGAFTEQSRYDPRSPYSATKAGADHLVRAYYHTYGLRTTISNCGNNYGPYQHPEKLIPKAISRLLRGQKVPIYGSGHNVRDWIHVRDHCHALDLITHRGEAGRTYLVGASNERTNLQIVRALLAILGLGEDRIEFVADRPGHDLRYALDAREIRDLLGWRPTTLFDQGLKETVEWYRAHPEWWEPVAP